MTMQAIRTTYDGIRYRSRTEARWAVFFTLIGARFRYEAEGFRTAEGPYLPDFELSFQEAPKVFFEVKGQEPTDRELKVAIALADESGCPVHIAVGPPAPDGVTIDVLPKRPIAESAFPNCWADALAEASRHQFAIFDDARPALATAMARRRLSPAERREIEWDRLSLEERMKRTNASRSF